MAAPHGLKPRAVYRETKNDPYGDTSLAFKVHIGPHQTHVCQLLIRIVAAQCHHNFATLMSDGMELHALGQESHHDFVMAVQCEEWGAS